MSFNVIIYNMTFNANTNIYYTQEEMAQILGVSLRQYVRIDNEEDLPRRDILRALINELDLTDEEIGAYIRKMTEKKA